MYDVIIIGAGPAGLTASIYGKRAGKKVLVLEATSPGGQIINAKEVDNYPGLPHIEGVKFAMSLYNQAIELGVEVKFERAIKIDVGDTKHKVTTNENVYDTTAIILAMGVKNKKLGIDREDELVGKGISYCATCDGNFFKGKDIAIQGGGNVALDDALYMADIANKVYLIHRRDEFRGDSTTVEKLKARDNVEFVLDSVVTSLNGDVLESITVKNNKTNEERKIDVSCLFVAIGQTPENNNIVKDIKLSDSGYIIGDEAMATNIPRIYVAGDIREKEVRQLTTAVNDGTIAMTMALKDL